MPPWTLRNYKGHFSLFSIQIYIGCGPIFFLFSFFTFLLTSHFLLQLLLISFYWTHSQNIRGWWYIYLLLYVYVLLQLFQKICNYCFTFNNKYFSNACWTLLKCNYHFRPHGDTISLKFLWKVKSSLLVSVALGLQWKVKWAGKLWVCVSLCLYVHAWHLIIRVRSINNTISWPEGNKVYLCVHGCVCVCVCLQR